MFPLIKKKIFLEKLVHNTWCYICCLQEKCLACFNMCHKPSLGRSPGFGTQWSASSKWWQYFLWLTNTCCNTLRGLTLHNIFANIQSVQHLLQSILRVKQLNHRPVLKQSDRLGQEGWSFCLYTGYLQKCINRYVCGRNNWLHSGSDPEVGYPSVDNYWFRAIPLDERGIETWF